MVNIRTRRPSISACAAHTLGAGLQVGSNPAQTGLRLRVTHAGRQQGLRGVCVWKRCPAIPRLGGAVQPSEWPLILAGPIVRRVEPKLASVWVALKEPATVRLDVWHGLEAASTSLAPMARG